LLDQPASPHSPSDSATLRISIVIPVAGSSDFLSSCLAAIAAQHQRPFEVIVSIDGEDQALESVATSFGSKIVRSVAKRGAACARNHGAQAATGDILLFIDADVVCPPVVTAQILQVFISNPELAAVFGSYDTEPAEPGFLSQFRNLLHHYIHQNSSPDSTTFWAGCGAIRRSVFEDVGGFREVPSPSTVEDIEIGYRLTESGYKIRLDKEIWVKHLKKWTLMSMCFADLWLRSFAWTLLLLDNPNRLVADKNLAWHSRISIIACLLAPMCLVLSSQPLLWSCLYIGLMIIANSKLLMFFIQIRGKLFAIKSVGALYLYYTCSGLGAILAMLFRSNHIPGRVYMRLKSLVHSS